MQPSAPEFRRDFTIRVDWESWDEPTGG